MTKKWQVGKPSGSMEAARVSKRSVGTSAKGCLEAEMAGTKESVLERFAVLAIAGGAKTLKIEYDEGYEEVYACPGDVGVDTMWQEADRSMIRALRWLTWVLW